jgi:hypothetical protein
MVRCYDVGWLIGTETGGRTSSFGSPQDVSMPATGVEISVSRKKFVNVCDNKSESGLIPDYIIENPISDDINHVDKALEFALALIGEKAANTSPHRVQPQ